MRVRRDAYGIPHLRAGSVDELAYLQGRVTAEDRGQQIEVERRRSEGRLAEIDGRASLPWDRFARRARLDDTARRCFDTLDPATKSWLRAYTEGVRAGGVAWQPWSSLGVFQVQHILFGTFPHKMWRAHVEHTLGPSAVGWFAIEGPSASGSNAWAVPGLIAGDPHRLLELPGVYQQIRLVCPEFDVAGLTFPGVPGVQHFGHAGGVAWAVTNAMADCQDLFVEDLSGLPASSELIDIRGEEPVAVEIIETERGPIIDGNLSLRTPARVASDLGFGALLPLLRSTTVDDVADAFAAWVEPVNSVLVADTTGRVLQLTAGRVPLRDDRNREVPVPAEDPRYAWRDGWAPMARIEVTSAVNANDRRPDTSPYGVDFSPPGRARRIRSLLDAGASPEKIHMDTAMPADRLDDGRQAAVARALCSHPALANLFTPSSYDPLFAPWLDPRVRIGLSVDGVLAGLGLDPADLVTDTPPATRWGARHVLQPILLPGLDAAIPPTELSGSTDSVLCTASIPGVSDACWRGPVARYVWDLADRRRSRWIVPFGAAGSPGSPHFLDQLPHWSAGSLIPVFPEGQTMIAYAEKLPGLGELTLIPLDPAAHAEIVHGWVIKPRNRFWGMGDHSVDQVREIYEFVDGLSTHHAYLIRIDEAPVGIFQTYEPAHDPVAECYEVRPGDFGLHLMLDGGDLTLPHLSTLAIPALLRFAFQDPARVRLVAEPDIRNDKAIRRLARHGFELGPEIDLGHKRARLVFLTRS